MQRTHSHGKLSTELHFSIFLGIFAEGVITVALKLNNLF